MLRKEVYIKMKLVNIKGNINYIENSCNIGCILNNKEAILVDSGLEDDVAKKIIRLLDDKGYSIGALINTHSHADHCGGNSYMQKKLGVSIYASKLEAAIIENPYLEPIYLSGGAAPLKELTNKFLMAKPSRVNHIIDKKDKELHIGPTVLNVVPLLGHAINHIGIAIDQVLFCGDSVISEDLILKHKIPFNVDIGAQFETLSFLKDSDYQVYIPSHGNPMGKEELIHTINKNISTLEDINNKIIQSLSTPKTLEEVEYSLFEGYNIKTNTLTQYYLLKTAIIAHINYLVKQNIVKKVIKNNRICWANKKV